MSLRKKHKRYGSWLESGNFLSELVAVISDDVLIVVAVLSTNEVG